jgi:hypothetical protein
VERLVSVGERPGRLSGLDCGFDVPMHAVEQDRTRSDTFAVAANAVLVGIVEIVNVVAAHRARHGLVPIGSKAAYGGLPSNATGNVSV